MRGSHTQYMRRAIALAKKGVGYVNPNPMVGCVIVKNDRVIAEGYHRRWGGDHAETMALKKVGKKAHGATLYISLEPCSHTGKTPPCAPQIAKSGIQEVYIAMKDPNPMVAGRGIKYLKKSSIRVYVGLEKQAAQALNPEFLFKMNKKRPRIILKMAMSLDGKIATHSGDSKWLSSPKSRKWVHKLRSQSDAILVGANTAILDNPHLTSHGKGRNPLRIVLDSKLKSPKNLRLFRDNKAPTLVVSGPNPPQNKANYLLKKGIQILRLSLKFKKLDIIKLVKYLSKNNVNQLLIEGGSDTSWEFIQKKLVDEVYFFITPKILGGRAAISPIGGTGFGKVKKALSVKNLQARSMGPDILIHGVIRK